MTWFALAILATILMTLINFGDKYIVEARIPSPRATLIYLAWANLPLALIVWAATGFMTLSLADSVPLVFAGAMTLFGNYFYFQAASQEEMSRIIVLLQLNPVYVLVMSVVFLGDSISLSQLLGFGFILFAATMVTLQRRKQTLQTVGNTSRKTFFLMLVATFLWSTSVVLTDAYVERLIIDWRSLLLTTALSSVGYWFAGMMLYLTRPTIRQAYNQHWQNPNYSQRTAWLSVAALEAVFVLRSVTIFAAFALGPVALISIIGSTSVFLGVLFGWVLTLWQPDVFKEDIQRESLLRKLAWAAVAFVGILLLRQ